MKTETKHTPGPWTYYLTVSDNGPVPQVQTVPVGPLGGTYATMICTLSQTGKKSRTQLANARLIAAAPELLHALKAIAPIVHAFTQDELSVTTIREAHEILSRMQSAISKAEGNA